MPKTKISKNRIAIISTIVFFCLLVVYLSVRGCGNNVGLTYDYEEITKGVVKKTISVTGTLEVMNSYTITSKISGMVTRIFVDFNQHVRKDQILAMIDSSEIEQMLLKMSARLEVAKLELLSAQRELEGKRNLFKDNLISQKEMERSELKYKQILSQHKQIEIDYNIALRNKSYCKILSPIDGIVISREVDPYTPISEKHVLFLIAQNLKRMKLIINVDETDIGYIKIGQKVLFTVSAYPEHTFTGVINQVRFNPIKKSDVVTYQSMVLCDNEGLLLKPGMTATATIEVARKENAIRIPNQAFIVSPVEIVERTEGKYIWIKQKLSVGKLPVNRIKVQTGVVGDHFTELLSKNANVGDSVLIGVRKKTILNNQ
jgi:HlyD family secretion protein